MKTKVATQTKKIEVRYNSTITIPLGDRFSTTLRTQMKNLCRTAQKLTFRKIGNSRDAILVIEKKNPILTYKIVFYKDKIVARALSPKWETLKEFEEIAKTEISLLLNEIEKDNCETNRRLYIC